MRYTFILLSLLAVCSSAQEEDSLLTLETDSLTLVGSIIAQAESYLGAPYVYGGTSESGFDCSGLTYRVFNDNGIALPRTVTAIAELGEPVERDSLLPGDVLIFHNPTHTGIYLGEGMFIHSSSWQDRGVVITSLDTPNYARRYHSARRIIPR